MKRIVSITLLCLLNVACTNSKLFDKKDVEKDLNLECNMHNVNSKQCEVLNSNNLNLIEKQTAIGLIYLFGSSDVSTDYSKAYKFLVGPAHQKNTEALNGLGIIYLYGLGVNKNLDLAQEYFEKANNLGDKVSKINLGELYRQKNNLIASEKWYKLAIIENPSKAYEGLSKIYLDQQKFEQAYRYSEKAAELGNTEAEYNLGVFYEQGIYVNKNLEKAIFWYEKAALKGHLDALSNLSLLKK